MTRAQAESMAYSLGITLYFDPVTGRVHQRSAPDTEQIDPGPRARVTSLFDQKPVP